VLGYGVKARKRFSPVFRLANALLGHMRVSADTRVRGTWQPGAESGFSGINLATPNGDLRR